MGLIFERAYIRAGAVGCETIIGILLCFSSLQRCGKASFTNILNIQHTEIENCIVDIQSQWCNICVRAGAISETVLRQFAALP